MTRFALLSIALLAAAPAVAQQQSPQSSVPPDSPEQQSASPKLQNLIQNCDAHKFETTVLTSVDGKPHDSKVRLCGNEGQSDAEWIATLRDAINKLTTNDDMPAATRNQIIAAIKAEIARLSGQVSDVSSSGSLPPGRSLNQPQSLSSDYSTLPPLTGAPAPPPHLLAPSSSASENGSAASTSSASAATVPEPKASALIDNAPAAAPAGSPPPPKVAIAAKPKLAFQCIGADFPGGGPCISLSRDTILSVKAGEPLVEPVSLRFVRRGDARAEISLGSMNKGQSLRLQIPNEVCSGVVSSEINIEVTRSGQVVDRLGPYLLHC